MAKPKIKTVAKKTIKTIETVGIVTEKVKDVGARVKKDVGNTLNTNADTPQQYATQRYQDRVHTTIDDSAYIFNTVGRKSFVETKNNIKEIPLALQEIKERRINRQAKKGMNKAPEMNTETFSYPSDMGTDIFSTKSDFAVGKTPDVNSKNGVATPKTAKNDIRLGNNIALKNAQNPTNPANPQTAKVPSGLNPKSGRAMKSPNTQHAKTVTNANSKISGAIKSNKTAKTITQANTKAMQKKVMLNRLSVNKLAEKSRKVAQYTKEAAKEAAKVTIKGVKAVFKAIKIAYKAARSLVAAIIAGGWISVVVIILMCLICALTSSIYGIFLSNETSDTGITMKTVIQEINQEYQDSIEAEKESYVYDELDTSGRQTDWRDVLAIYAVKVNGDADDPQEIATIDESKKQILKMIFWDMNSIHSRLDTVVEMETVEIEDDNGNIIETEIPVYFTTLYITVESKSVDDMIDQYNFTQEQTKLLDELLSDKYRTLWNSLIYGTGALGTIDISSLDFANETANDMQKKVVVVAMNSEKYGIASRKGYCQAWVADVYQVTVGNRGYAASAIAAGRAWSVSQDWSKIQVGATVYGLSSNQYGHVGIYIGNGMVAHILISDEVTIQSLDSWVSQFKGVCWGWENGKNLTDDPQYDCVGGLI